MAEMVKNLTIMQETQLDPWMGKVSLEKGVATHSVLLPGEFLREEPDRLQSMGSQSRT